MKQNYNKGEITSYTDRRQTKMTDKQEVQMTKVDNVIKRLMI